MDNYFAEQQPTKLKYLAVKTQHSRIIMNIKRKITSNMRIKQLTVALIIHKKLTECI